jgi:cobalt/nickel transport system permease protein
MTLFAVHISDGVLAWPWLYYGFGAAACLLFLAMWRIRDEEIPRIGILTASFFISALIHIRLPGVTVHLLLTGLIGVLLGRRAALAIFVGLLLQKILTEHGGYFTLGVNTCVMTIPALASFAFFHCAHRLPWIYTPVGRAGLVGVSAIILFLSGVYSWTLLTNTSLTELDQSALDLANARLIEPWVIAGSLLFATAAIVLERRLENTPEFPLGFLIGEVSVLMTAGLNCVVLLVGGETNWPILPLMIVIAHLPFAVVEGVILGFVVGFLARAKPEMLGIDGSPKR